MHDKGLVYMAFIKSPFNKNCVALTPPHPGHGMPNIALNGQPTGIGIWPIQRKTTNTNPNIAIVAINNS